MNRESLLTDEEIKDASKKAAIPFFPVFKLFEHRGAMQEARAIAKAQDIKTRQATLQEVGEWLVRQHSHDALYSIFSNEMHALLCGEMPELPRF